MKKTIFLLALSLLQFSLFADDKISLYSENKIDEFMALRMSLSALPSKQEAIEKINSFEKELELKENALDLEQETFIFKNFCQLERFNYLYDDKKNRGNLYKDMNALMKENESYLEKNEKSSLNKWAYVLAGDTISSAMSSSVSNILKNGTKIKPYYEKALEKDSNLSYTNTNIAQWYLQAPKVSGGSEKKAREHFEKAVKCAKNPAELYFAKIFLSQFLFEVKEKEKSAALLNEALALNPESSYVKLLQEENSKGKSLFKYNRTR